MITTIGRILKRLALCWFCGLDGADLFMTFLQSEFSEENLQFWQSCEELKQLRGQALHHKARQIFAKFLEPGAPAEVINLTLQSYAREILSQCLYLSILSPAASSRYHSVCLSLYFMCMPYDYHI